jgi:hypothetical protein
MRLRIASLTVSRCGGVERLAGEIEGRIGRERRLGQCRRRGGARGHERVERREPRRQLLAGAGIGVRFGAVRERRCRVAGALRAIDRFQHEPDIVLLQLRREDRAHLHGDEQQADQKTSERSARDQRRSRALKAQHERGPRAARVTDGNIRLAGFR